jgi:transposase
MRQMKKQDMRSLSRDARHERRQTVISLRATGMFYKEISRLTGLSVTGICDICKRHRAGGDKALVDRTGGRKAGQHMLLSPTEQKRIKKLICDKTPDQLKLPWALWTRAAVAQLVWQECGIKLGVRSTGNYLRRWGFTAQKPIKKAYEQDTALVTKWRAEQYPAMVRQAKKEGAEIHFCDETGLRGDDVRGRSYAPVGQTPVVKVKVNRSSLSIISSVTNKGQMRWKIFKGALNADIFIDFMARLVKGNAGKKVLLVVDNLRVHHSKPVKAWLEQNKEKIEVFYLPSYSPELNPDEMANADLKQAVTKLAPARTQHDLQQAASRHLRSVQKQPQRIKSYFQHEPVKYAA